MKAFLLDENLSSSKKQKPLPFRGKININILKNQAHSVLIRFSPLLSFLFPVLYVLSNFAKVLMELQIWEGRKGYSIFNSVGKTSEGRLKPLH